MGKQLLSVPSFTAGELSPRMEGRTDFAKYFNGCTILENFVVLPHGPVTRRPGTYHVSQVKTSANSTRLIPFEFSTTQTYMLEFGNLYIRFLLKDCKLLMLVSGDCNCTLVRLLTYNSTFTGNITGLLPVSL